MVTSGVAAMRDPYVVLAYLGSFSARGDSSVVTLFLSAWILSVSNSLQQAGVVTGILQVIALCAAPFIGVLADRFSRAGVTFGVALVGCLGYLLLGLLDDPSTWSWQLVAAIVCLGNGKE